MLFQLVFANDRILLCLFFFFFFFDFYFLIPAVIAQILVLTAELVIAIGVPTKEVKSEIEIHPVPTESKI